MLTCFLPVWTSRGSCMFAGRFLWKSSRFFSSMWLAFFRSWFLGRDQRSRVVTPGKKTCKAILKWFFTFYFWGLRHMFHILASLTPFVLDKLFLYLLWIENWVIGLSFFHWVKLINFSSMVSHILRLLLFSKATHLKVFQVLLSSIIQITVPGRR